MAGVFLAFLVFAMVMGALGPFLVGLFPNAK